MADEGDVPEATAKGAGAPVFRAMPGSLYVVATPLGNARDLTLRALDVLRSADVVAAEDTRVSAPLLARHGISAHLLSLHAHNEARRSDAIVASLAAGKSVALVSDAGTPAISDPGARLVRAVRDAGYPVVPIPGPSAVTAALCAAGLDAERFVFLGFLPAQVKARRVLLASVAALPMALVVYEAPHRVRATVAELALALPGGRTLVVARELTKMFETIARVPLADGAAWLDAERQPAARRIRADRRRADGSGGCAGSAIGGCRALACGAGRRAAAGARSTGRRGGERGSARDALRARARAQAGGRIAASATAGARSNRLVASRSSTTAASWLRTRQRHRTMPSVGFAVATRRSLTSTVT